MKQNRRLQRKQPASHLPGTCFTRGCCFSSGLLVAFPMVSAEPKLWQSLLGLERPSLCVLFLSVCADRAGGESREKISPRQVGPLRQM